MTQYEHIRTAETILNLADERSNQALLEAVCRTLMALYWQREAERTQENEALWLTCQGAR
jgi:hypothetical protein